MPFTFFPLRFVCRMFPSLSRAHGPECLVIEPVWVRRGKAQNSSGRVNKPTRQLTLQPVAAEASMEAMKCSKPLVQKARKRVGGDGLEKRAQLRRRVNIGREGDVELG